MSEATVTIVHLSDLHLSEYLGEPPENLKVPHRYGHDPQIFFALDQFLQNKDDWDLLAISGDISRVGDPASFLWARNWLDSRIFNGAQSLGLDLHDHPERYILVPGNHDRFNGHLTQTSLEAYANQFGVILPGQIKPLTIKGVRVNFHLFDSSLEGGGFAYGQIDSSELSPRILNPEELNVAMLHHHFIQPPQHPREPATELLNTNVVAAYFLGNLFDAVFFGHTHRGYFDFPRAD